MIKFRFVLIVLLFSLFSKAQKDSSRYCFIIKANAPALVSGLIYDNIDRATGCFEIGLKKRHSVQLEGSYVYSSVQKSGDQYTRISHEVSPQYKFYEKKENNFRGFYVGGYGKILNVTSIHHALPGGGTDWFYVKTKYSYLGGGLITGFQTYFFRHLVVDAMIGLGMIHGKKRNTESVGIVPVPETYNSYTDFMLNLNLGYRF